MPYLHANRVAIAEGNQIAVWIKFRCVGNDPNHAAIEPGFELIKIYVGSIRRLCAQLVWADKGTLKMYTQQSCCIVPQIAIIKDLSGFRIEIKHAHTSVALNRRQLIFLAYSHKLISTLAVLQNSNSLNVSFNPDKK